MASSTFIGRRGLCTKWSSKVYIYAVACFPVVPVLCTACAAPLDHGTDSSRGVGRTENPLTVEASEALAWSIQSTDILRSTSPAQVQAISLNEFGRGRAWSKTLSCKGAFFDFPNRAVCEPAWSLFHPCSWPEPKSSNVMPQ